MSWCAEISSHVFLGRLMVKVIQNLTIPTLPFEYQNESQFYLHIPFPPDKKFSPSWFSLTGKDPNMIWFRPFLFLMTCVSCWFLPPPTQCVCCFYIWLFRFYWLFLCFTRPSIMSCRRVLKFCFVTPQSKKFFTFCIFRIYVFGCIGFCFSRVN